MKNLAVIMLCLLSSVASAKDIEELVVTAKRLRIVIEHISANHKQNLLQETGTTLLLLQQSRNRSDRW